MRVWMDMANSPHPVLLGPVAEELERAGHDVWVTARDHAQTADLTRRRWPEAVFVGGSSPTSRPGKGRVLLERVLGLRREAARRAPDVAVSLNSYAQMVAARTAGIPSVTLMDYDFQPANHLAFRLAERVVVPVAFPPERLRHYGARSESRIHRFDGYKEELYLDQLNRSADGPWSQLVDNDDQARVVFRPPPTGAMYHREGNLKFDELLSRLSRREDLCVLVLARFPEQRAHYRSLPGLHVAQHTVNGLEALLSADAFVGAGGTMCREAALLGIPAYTLFAGQLATVDARLISEGRLYDLRTGTADLDITRRGGSGARRIEWERVARRSSELRAWFASIIERAGGAGTSGGTALDQLGPA